MLPITGRRLQRFELIQAAHHFILTALPLRAPDSRRALAHFAEVSRRCELSVPESESILLTLLGVLEPHAHGRLPSMVDRFLAQRRFVPDPICRFEQCVDDVIRYRGVGSPEVQQAIAIIEEHFSDSRLTQSRVAEQTGVSPQALSATFSHQTGLTFGEYLRDVRLDRAARLLLKDDASVKEIWAAVGYNDGSNFSHQFRDRFAVAPRDYRALAIRSALPGGTLPRTVGDRNSDNRGGDASLLIVDDDTGTRETLRWHLRASGYRVALARTAKECLDAAAGGSPDLIILDYHLPDMTGLECLERLRRQAVERAPAVLLFTADWDVADDAERIATLGAMFASKLCDLREVERLVESLLTARALGTASSDPAE